MMGISSFSRCEQQAILFGGRWTPGAQLWRKMVYILFKKVEDIPFCVDNSGECDGINV